MQKKVKVVGVIAAVCSSLVMFFGLGVVTYYVTDLRIRGVFAAASIFSTFLVNRTVRLIFDSSKEHAI